MTSKVPALAPQEHDLLRALARGGRTVSGLFSTQRLRFELLGLIEDRADGICLTDRGRALALAGPGPAASSGEVAPHNAPRDRRGRRLGLHRRSPF